MKLFDGKVFFDTPKRAPLLLFMPLQMKPYYAIFRDSSMANDNVATNFDQKFKMTLQIR